MAPNRGHFRTTAIVRDVSFVNPVPVHKIWRSGTSYSGTIIVPTGYGSITWEIRQHVTNTVVASGSGTTVTHTFTFLGTDKFNTYALFVYATKLGYTNIIWMSPGEFTCYPPIFNQAGADVVINLAVSYTGANSNFTDYAATGRKIYIYGIAPPECTSTTSKNLTGLTSPQTWTTQTGLTWTAGRQIKISSAANPNVDYINATVQSYNSGTGALSATFTIPPPPTAGLHGSGVHTDWQIALREELNMFYWNSSNPLKPVHVIAHAAALTSAQYLLKLGSNHNFIFDGGDDEATPYGMTITKGTGGVSECVYITPADGTHDSYNWMINGIRVDNTSYLIGGSGFVVQMVNNGTWNDGTTRFDHITVHDIYVTNCGNEGFYWGHTNPGSIPEFIKSSNVLMYRFLSNHTKNEGIQMAGIVIGELFDSSFQDSGLGLAGGQDYNTQVSSENIDLTWYMNQGLSTRSLHQTKTGPKGGNLEMFANVFETTNPSGTNANFWHLDNNTTLATMHNGVGYNTFVINSGVIFQIYNDTGFGVPTQIWQFYADGNVLVTNTTTQATYNNGFNSSQTIMNNKIYTSTAGPGFTSVLLKNYRPLSLASDMFNFTTNATAAAAQVHPWFMHDFDGYKREPSNICAGAFAGIQLMMGL